MYAAPQGLQHPVISWAIVSRAAAQILLGALIGSEGAKLFLNFYQTPRRDRSLWTAFGVIRAESFERSARSW